MRVTRKFSVGCRGAENLLIPLITLKFLNAFWSRIQKYFVKNICISFRSFSFFFSKIKEGKCTFFSSPLIFPILRENKLIRSTGHACDRKCYILGVIVPKNSNYSTHTNPLLSSVSKTHSVRTEKRML